MEKINHQQPHKKGNHSKLEPHARWFFESSEEVYSDTSEDPRLVKARKTIGFDLDLYDDDEKH